MPQNAFFLRTCDLLVSQKTTQRHFFSIHRPLSTVTFATATVLAFVLPHDSRFNFHCYTHHEATPTQKSAWRCAATSHDFLRKRLQSAFTLANQLHWITQYMATHAFCYQKTEKKRKKYHQTFSHMLSFSTAKLIWESLFFKYKRKKKEEAISHLYSWYIVTHKIRI